MFPEKIIHKISGTKSILMGISDGKNLISPFQQFFDSIKKILILAGRLETNLSFYEI